MLKAAGNGERRNPGRFCRHGSAKTTAILSPPTSPAVGNRTVRRGTHPRRCTLPPKSQNCGVIAIARPAEVPEVRLAPTPASSVTTQAQVIVPVPKKERKSRKRIITSPSPSAGLTDEEESCELRDGTITNGDVDCRPSFSQQTGKDSEGEE